MVINTRIFGEVTIDDGKMIHFPAGIIGFPELVDFALIHDAEQGLKGGISWMQSVQEPGFAMPVIDPLAVKQDYAPLVDDELLKTIGGMDNILVLVTITPLSFRRDREGSTSTGGLMPWRYRARDRMIWPSVI